MSERLRSRDPNSSSNKCYSIFFEDGCGRGDITTSSLTTTTSTSSSTRNSDVLNNMRVGVSEKKSPRGFTDSGVGDTKEDNHNIDNRNGDDDNTNHDTNSNNSLRSNRNNIREQSLNVNCVLSKHEDKISETGKIVKDDKIEGDICNGDITRNEDKSGGGGGGNNIQHENIFTVDAKYGILLDGGGTTSSNTSNDKSRLMSSMGSGGGGGGERKRKYEDFLKDDDDYIADDDIDDYSHHQNNVDDGENILNEKTSNSSKSNGVPDNLNPKNCEDKNFGLENMKKEAPAITITSTTHHKTAVPSSSNIIPHQPSTKHPPSTINISTKMNEIISANVNEKREENAAVSCVKHFENEANNNYTENIEMKKIKYDDANSEIMFQVGRFIQH